MMFLNIHGWHICTYICAWSLCTINHFFVIFLFLCIRSEAFFHKTMNRKPKQDPLQNLKSLANDILTKSFILQKEDFVAVPKTSKNKQNGSQNCVECKFKEFTAHGSKNRIIQFIEKDNKITVCIFNDKNNIDLEIDIIGNNTQNAIDTLKHAYGYNILCHRMGSFANTILEKLNMPNPSLYSQNIVYVTGGVMGKIVVVCQGRYVTNEDEVFHAGLQITYEPTKEMSKPMSSIPLTLVLEKLDSELTVINTMTLEKYSFENLDEIVKEFQTLFPPVTYTLVASRSPGRPLEPTKFKDEKPYGIGQKNPSKSRPPGKREHLESHVDEVIRLFE